MSNFNRATAVFANRLMVDFCHEITGSNETLLEGITPETKFIVGRLSPKGEEIENTNSSNVHIHSIGYNVLIKPSDIDNGLIKVYPTGSLFYRLLPSLEQQQNAILREAQSTGQTNAQTFSQLWEEQLEIPKRIECDVVPVYKRIDMHEIFNDCIELKLKDYYDAQKGFGDFGEKDSFNVYFDNKIQEFKDRVIDEKNAYCIIKEPVSIDDVKNISSWNEFLKKNIDDSDRKPINLNWYFYIKVRMKKVSEEIIKLTITLCNDSKPQKSNNGKIESDKNRINTLFNAGVKTTLKGISLQPIVMNYFKDDYKYDRTQYAIGINCTPEISDDKQTIETNLLPIYRQYRLKTSSELNITFTDLISNPIVTLNIIKKGMLKEKQRWLQLLDEKQSKKEITPKGVKKFENEVQDFEREINRFELGIKIIEREFIIKNAFNYMNMSFQNASKGYSGWRLFQIVFIVSLIPDLACCENSILKESEKNITKLNFLDLLYFPTGGGKTEAFLGVLIFNMFFDRLRGKSAGVTSIIKYPLRLLSVQQVQRVANILACAELIRRKLNNTEQGEKFSLGYFVGNNNTPNKLEKDEITKLQSMTQRQLNEEYKVIDVCPFCSSTNINVIYNSSSNSLQHICDNIGCESGNVLPVYIVDTEIYKHLPTVIIGTVDKLASIGNNRRFRNIMGSVTHMCSKHGYMSETKCDENNCDGQIQEVNLYDPAPSLVIQDELHLIRESLGTYASHYETFFQYYINNLSKSKRPAKIIGATATISSYKEQAAHLYQKTPIRFPCESPDLEKDFYSFVDRGDLHRLVLGYAPFGRAVINSVVYSLKYMRVALEKYMLNPNLVLEINDIGINDIEEAKRVVMNYWTVLEYNNVKVDGNNVINALDDPINTELASEGITTYDPRKMTGDDSFQDVRKILASVEKCNTPDDVFKSFNIIVATSMISHGVDADRFNNMFFYGIPSNIAEYIQAYSRAGRKYTGIVIDIMRPMREKDQSYLKNFVKTHEYKDILVEPVPINRWASKAIDRTLPGIFSGLILNYYDLILKKYEQKVYLMKGLKKVINEGYIDKEEVKKQIYEIYCCEFKGVRRAIGNQYRKYIDNFIDDIFEKLQTTSFDNITYITSALKQLGYPVMRSLRETDASLIVELR